MTAQIIKFPTKRRRRSRISKTAQQRGQPLVVITIGRFAGRHALTASCQHVLA
jgi:hypothetical protein